MGITEAESGLTVISPHFGIWFSLVERYIWDVEVAGSNPAIPIREIVRHELNHSKSIMYGVKLNVNELSFFL